MQRRKSLFKISAMAIAVLHGINKFIENTSVTFNTKPSGNYYHWKSGDIYYKKQGQGEPILLIHDLTVYSSNYEWSRVIETLSANYTVYAIDLIGCGKSDKPEITYTNYFYVQMISDFVKDVIQEKTKAAVTGLSGSFVLMANSIHEELFSDIILINPPAVSALKKTPDDRSKIIVGLFHIPVVGKTAYYIETNKTNTEYYLTEKCFYNPFSLTETTIKAYYTAAHTSFGNGKALLASLDGQYLNIDISKVLQNTKNNIMIITGDHLEKKNEVENAYLKLNPNIITHSVPETKQLPQLENPSKFIELI
jgi:pimeloyl-ACP methyl ester carboxylesterase